jgi:hypothetical protein
MTSSSPSRTGSVSVSIKDILKGIGYGLEQVNRTYFPWNNPAFKSYPPHTKAASYQTAGVVWFATGSIAIGVVLGLAGVHRSWEASNPAEIMNVNRIGYQLGGAIGGKSREVIKQGTVKVEDWNALNDQKRQQKSAGRSATR